MSTKTIDYWDPEREKLKVHCKLCDAFFLPGGAKVNIPDNVCIWCFYRGRLLTRYMFLWSALEDVHTNHAPPNCDCSGCKAFRLALPVMSATMKQSEDASPSEGRKEAK